MNFSDRLKNLRLENSITQEELSKEIGVRRPAISGYETKNQQPDFDRLNKIADFFKVSVDYLLCRTDLRNYTDTTMPSNLKPSEKELLTIFRSNSPDEQLRILSVVKAMQQPLQKNGCKKKEDTA